MEQTWGGKDEPGRHDLGGGSLHDAGLLPPDGPDSWLADPGTGMEGSHMSYSCPECPGTGVFLGEEGGETLYQCENGHVFKESEVQAGGLGG